MKLKSVLFVFCISLFTQGFAASTDLQGKTGSDALNPVMKSQSYPGSCDIEVINDSRTHHIEVYAELDNGVKYNMEILDARESNFWPLDAYDGYCHEWMNNFTFKYRNSYMDSGPVRVGSIVRVILVNDQVQVKVTAK